MHTQKDIQKLQMSTANELAPSAWAAYIYFYVDLWVLYADHIWLPFPHIDGSCGLPCRVTTLFLQGNPCPFLWTVINLHLIWGQYFVGTSESVKKHLMITQSWTWTQKMCQAIGLMSGHSNNICAPFTVSVCTHESLVKNFRQRKCGDWSWKARLKVILWRDCVVKPIGWFWIVVHIAWTWVEQGSFFVVESFAEYFFATWQGLGTSQVVFLLVEAIGRLPDPSCSICSNMVKY
jgi:hypothetical protein